MNIVQRALHVAIVEAYKSEGIDGARAALASLRNTRLSDSEIRDLALSKRNFRAELIDVVANGETPSTLEERPRGRKPVVISDEERARRDQRATLRSLRYRLRKALDQKGFLEKIKAQLSPEDFLYVVGDFVFDTPEQTAAKHKLMREEYARRRRPAYDPTP